MHAVILTLPHAFMIGLEVAYPDATPVDNMEVIYTVNFEAYNNSNIGYTIQYEVIGKGEFKYIEGSLKLR